MTPAVSSSEVVKVLYSRATPRARELGMQEFSQLLDRLERGYQRARAFRSGQRVPVREHLSVYFQGRTGFLKLQTYSLPLGASCVLAQSIGNSTSGFDQVRRWVFRAASGRISQVLPDAEGMFPIDGPEQEAQLFIVAVYDNTFACRLGWEQIWIEIAALEIEAERIAVLFGGDLKDPKVESAWAIGRKPQPMFSRLEFKEPAVDELGDFITPRFRALMKQYHASNPAVSVDSDSSAWSRAIDLWLELESQRWSWATVELASVVDDLLLFASVSDVGQ